MDDIQNAIEDEDIGDGIRNIVPKELAPFNYARFVSVDVEKSFSRPDVHLS